MWVTANSGYCLVATSVEEPAPRLCDLRGRVSCRRMVGTGALLCCGSMVLALLACSRYRSHWLSDVHADSQPAGEVVVLEAGNSDSEANQNEGDRSMVYVSNALSGECLDWADQIVVATTCNGSTAKQKWTYVDQRLRIPLSRCLDSDGVLHIWPCAASEPMSRSQSWSYSSSTSLLQNGGTHACLHLQDRGNGSNLLSLQPCSVADERQKWVMKMHPPRMPQASSSSSGASRTSINSAAMGAELSGTTPPPAAKLKAAKETTKKTEAAMTTLGTLTDADTGTAMSVTVKPSSRPQPTTNAFPALPLSVTAKSAATDGELPPAEAPQASTKRAKINNEKQPPSTSTVAGLAVGTIKCDEKEQDKQGPHLRKHVPAMDAETDSHAKMQAVIRFQHHGGCLRAHHNLAYLDHCNQSDMQSTWTRAPGGLLVSENGECMDSAGDFVFVEGCDVTKETQQWTITGDPGDLGARIKSGTGRCLGTHWTLAEPSARVYLSNCNSDDFTQEWTVEHTQVPVRETRPIDWNLVVRFVGALFLALTLYFIFAVPLQYVHKKRKKPQPELPPNYDFLRDSTLILNEYSLNAELSQNILGPVQQQPAAFRALGICGFAHRRAKGHHEALDALNDCGCLGNSYILCPTDPPLQLIISGQLRTFDNAEAAFQALKFSGMADIFEGLSGEEALQRARELSGAEDRQYDGRGSMWKAMFEVIALKFRIGTAAAVALETTGDDFLLCHSCEEGFDALWSNNFVGNGMNWLGMQLMLLRSSRTGWRRWAEFIESNFDITTGQPLDIEGRPWIAWHQTVFRATTAVQADLQDQEEMLPTHDSKAVPPGVLEQQNGNAFSLGEMRPHAQPEMLDEAFRFPDDHVSGQRRHGY